MGHERLKHLKDCLLCCIESQMNHLGEVDAEELGEAIDMLKDLEEAIYYNTVTEAMKGEDKEMNWGGDKHHTEKYYTTPISDDDDTTPDHWAGRSPHSRRMYMESKQLHTDKATQLRELEKYMQELTNDIVEMISDASVEEKQYLEKKMTTLAAKIGQMK